MVPGGMAGSHQAAQAAVKMALEALQKALPGLEAGSELHSTVLKAVTDISKHMAEGAQNDPTAVIQQLMAAQRQAQQGPQQAAMHSMFPPAAGGAPPPAAA